MEKNLLKVIMVSAILLFSATSFLAQTKLLHYWHFNNTLPTTGGGGTHFGTGKMNSDYTKPNVTTGYLRFLKVAGCLADTGYWDNLLGDSINQRPGYGACCPAYTATANNSAVRTRNPTDSMQFLWYIPTKNFKNIKLTWGAEASSTTSGPHRLNYSYSLDSGATFITTNLPKLFDSAGTGWGKITLNLSTLTTINNNNKLMLCIRTGTPNAGGSGNTRYDNITVEGDSIIAGPSGLKEYGYASNDFKLYPNPASDKLIISSAKNESSEILILNLIGQVVLSSKDDGKQQPIDVSTLTNGIYFVRINDLNGENKAVLKFVKN